VPEDRQRDDAACETHVVRLPGAQDDPAPVSAANVAFARGDLADNPGQHREASI